MRTEAHEQAAEAVADRVLRVPAPPPVLHGQALAPTTRAVLEPRFQHDFSRVRVHTDSAAADSARTLNALAFTSGHDIVLGRHAPALHSPAGRKLLAHELAHVVQQSHGVAEGIQRKPLVLPPAGTNYRFDTAQITADDLSDPDIVARMQSMSRPQLRAYRERVGDSAVQSFIGTLLVAPELTQVKPGFLPLTKDNVDEAAALNYWEQRTLRAYEPTYYDDRLFKSPEERDAVYAAIWHLRPEPKSTSATEIITIPPSNERANALLYRISFDPPEQAGRLPRVGIAFLNERRGTVVQPAAEPPKLYVAPELSFDTEMNFPEAADQWFAKHRDERRQLGYWLKQQGGTFKGVIETKSVPAKGPPRTTLIRASGRKEKDKLVELNVELLPGRATEVRPPDDYRGRDYADLLIHEAQTTPHKTLGDQLGHVDLGNTPPNEQLSVKYAVAQYWTLMNTRNAEAEAVVPIAGTNRSVFYALRFRADNEVDVERVGDVGSSAKLSPTSLDVARVHGFDEHSADPAQLTSWLGTRYPGVKPKGTTVAELRQSVNAEMRTRVTAAEWYEKNYKLFVLGPAAARSRLKSVHGQVDKQVPAAEMKPFADQELKVTELALQTLDDNILPLLRNVRLGRQKQALKRDGTPDVTSEGHPYGGMTFPGSTRMIMIYDAGVPAAGGPGWGFMGGPAGMNVREIFTVVHEFGHVVESKAASRAAFNKLVAREGVGPFTDYASLYPERESFAEAFAIYQADPEWLRVNHPAIWTWMDQLNRTGKTPKVK